MKKILVISILGLIFNIGNSYAQNVSCNELYEIVINNHDYSTSVSCYGSSFLVKATYYECENVGFVIAYVKQNDYDYRGKPYIFCGVSLMDWSNFKASGMYGSWGKAFYKYIKPHTCNCY